MFALTLSTALLLSLLGRFKLFPKALAVGEETGTVAALNDMLRQSGLFKTRVARPAHQF